MMTSTSYVNMEPEHNCFLFRKCCLCIPLRIGCLILGYISLLSNLMITLFFAGSIAVMTIFTYSFRYLHMKQTQTGDVAFHENPSDRAKLHLAIMVVLLVGCLNVAWLMLNGLLLIGLHKKRPGPIRIHAAVAAVRLLLSILGLLSVQTSKATIFCWVEVCLSAYFIMMYYAYSLQLEREQKTKEMQPTENTLDDVAFSYSNKIDKAILTEKDHIKVLNV